MMREQLPEIFAGKITEMWGRHVHLPKPPIGSGCAEPYQQARDPEKDPLADRQIDDDPAAIDEMTFQAFDDSIDRGQMLKHVIEENSIITCVLVERLRKISYGHIVPGTSRDSGNLCVRLDADRSMATPFQRFQKPAVSAADLESVRMSWEALGRLHTIENDFEVILPDGAQRFDAAAFVEGLGILIDGDPECRTEIAA